MKHLFKLFVLLSSFAIGFSTAKHLAIPYFKIKKELDPVSLFSALVSVIVVYLFYTYIDKDKEDRVREKNLVLGRIEEIYQLVKEQSREFSFFTLPYSKAAANTKRITVQLKSLEDILKEIKLNHHKAEFELILDQVRHLKDLLTSDEENEKEEAGITIKDGIVFYSANRMKQIDSSYDSLTTIILKYQLKINRS